jgi:hypothetical protein
MSRQMKAQRLCFAIPDNVPLFDQTLLEELPTMLRDTGGKVRTVASWCVSASGEISEPIPAGMR